MHGFCVYARYELRISPTMIAMFRSCSSRKPVLTNHTRIRANALPVWMGLHTNGSLAPAVRSLALLLVCPRCLSSPPKTRLHVSMLLDIPMNALDQSIRGHYTSADSGTASVSQTVLTRDVVHHLCPTTEL